MSILNEHGDLGQMRNEERLMVDGYLFGNEEDAKMAKEEKGAIAYLEERIHYDDINTSLRIYEKALKEKIFKTPVGHDFLKKMQREMIEHGMPEEKIPPIPLYKVYSRTEENRPVRIFQVKAKEDNNKEYLRFSLWMNIALVILVIAMFGITLLGETTNVLNYRYKIENEYSIWEQELEEREKLIREKETELWNE